MIFIKIYFQSLIKKMLKKYKLFTQDPWLLNLQKFSIGLFSGILGSCVNIPFDVAKSRIQGPQPVPGEIKYRTTTSAIMIVYKEEG